MFTLYDTLHCKTKFHIIFLAYIPFKHLVVLKNTSWCNDKLGMTLLWWVYEKTPPSIPRCRTRNRCVFTLVSGGVMLAPVRDVAV